MKRAKRSMEVTEGDRIAFPQSFEVSRDLDAAKENFCSDLVSQEERHVKLQAKYTWEKAVDGLSSSFDS
jgi:hypothetical protein